ncbi:MAG: hypothetical protein M1832_003274 [Thelocarpon impressellum]|nr:MAG: hypothetical protein M1832_003274 [Thelocarpon impressellum]
MKLSLNLAVLGLSALAAAQVNLSDLPTCAQGCVGSSVNVPGCSNLDIKCICSNSGYLRDLSCCISKACPQSDQSGAIKFASSLCATVGVSVPDKVTCDGASSSGSSSASSSSTSSTSSSSTGSSDATASAAIVGSATTANAAAATNALGNGMGLAGAVAAVAAVVL